MKKLATLLIHFGILSLLLTACNPVGDLDDKDLLISIPTAGNTWIMNDMEKTSTVISSNGIINWCDKEDVIRTFFYTEQKAKISIGLHGKVRSGISEIKVTYGSKTKKITLENSKFENIYIAEFRLENPGYHFIDLQGVNKEDSVFADIQNILIATDSSQAIKYVKDDFYFGRRGPSTHLIFDNPEGVNHIEWFYNEIEISKGNDVIGSYFMANGCKQGYFGIQVNSPTERRILFSIWSPFHTDDPNSIPADQRIKLLKKGMDVHTGEFGNEGSGGQSYKVFNWKANTRYGFLLGAKPTGNNSTIFTAYFYDPELATWSLIASFERPKTDTYLNGLYSFLENFIPNTGVIERKGGFYNQWLRDAKGNWYEINEARFSADATARKDARLDYSGGINDEGFYLKNCGFTNDKVEIGTVFKRAKSTKPPSIDFSTLE